MLAYSAEVTAWEGRTNGAFSALLGEFGLLGAGLVLALTGSALTVYRAAVGTSVERLVLMGVIAICIAPWFALGRRDVERRYLDGLVVWGDTVNATGLRAWAATAATPAAVAAPPPDFWLVSALKGPLGVVAPPGGVRAFIEGPLPDDVRVLPPTGEMILGWHSTGSRRRHLVVTAPGQGPPAGLDPARHVWRRVADGVWVGLAEMH
ncbi:MAG: hypothetical protein K2Q20_02895 [Phycisphaerales bacterium]|nr:hypothetical protein [Phycisphaerales bacterium]